MKTASDPRHLERQKLVQKLFEWSFKNKNFSEDDFENNNKLYEIVKNKETIDHEIIKAAKEWPINQIAKVDLAILRLAVFELLINKSNPQKVVIDEAIELAKEFGGEKSDKFINGVLGTLIKTWEK